MLNFTVNGFVRYNFGFVNPNHAAAAICALFPFCWGLHRKWRWAGCLAGVALCVMLAMTYSRTGVVVLAIEAIVLWMTMYGESWHAHRSRSTILGLAVAVCVASGVIWWMWPRLALDGAILNRPKIWLAGLQLFAANPLGAGYGNSGEIATAFMLPDGMTVRTLVNSHLTLLAEMGLIVGGAWLAFIALALCLGWTMRRTWIAFAGLVLSACSSSVFDWHVLFDFAEFGEFGIVNFVLEWVLFVAFFIMGLTLILSIRRRAAEFAERFRWCSFERCVFPIESVVVGLCAVVFVFRSGLAPNVHGEYVVGSGVGATRHTNALPCVYRDAEWNLKTVVKRFPNGARFCIRPGIPENAPDTGDVWLFGEVAEASHRFPNSSVTVVDPPEFYEPENNVRIK